MKKIFLLIMCIFCFICLTGCSNTVKIEFIIDGDSKIVNVNKGSIINDNIIPIVNNKNPFIIAYDELFTNIYNNEIVNENIKLYVKRLDGLMQFGGFCTLEEAYKNNLLTIENIQEINDNYNSKVKIDNIDMMTENMIKNDYLYRLLNSSNYDEVEISLYDIEIFGYYGSFNEYYVVRLKDKKAVYGDVVDIIDIDNIIFEYTGPNFIVWNQKK